MTRRTYRLFFRLPAAPRDRQVVVDVQAETIDQACALGHELAAVITVPPADFAFSTRTTPEKP